MALKNYENPPPIEAESLWLWYKARYHDENNFSEKLKLGSSYNDKAILILNNLKSIRETWNNMGADNQKFMVDYCLDTTSHRETFLLGYESLEPHHDPNAGVIRNTELVTRQLNEKISIDIESIERHLKWKLPAKSIDRLNKGLVYKLLMEWQNTNKHIKISNYERHPAVRFTNNTIEKLQDYVSSKKYKDLAAIELLKFNAVLSCCRQVIKINILGNQPIDIF